MKTLFSTNTCMRRKFPVFDIEIKTSSFSIPCCFSCLLWLEIGIDKNQNRNIGTGIPQANCQRQAVELREKKMDMSTIIALIMAEIKLMIRKRILIEEGGDCHCIGYICIGCIVTQLYRHVCIGTSLYKGADTTVLH